MKISCDATVATSFIGVEQSNTAVYVGICPLCDKTHLNVILKGVGQVMLTFDPRMAEAAGKNLISPEPFSEDQVRAI